MPATYPASVYSPRTKANKTGVVYEPSATTRLFAEDVQKLDDEVVAIENVLPVTAAKTFIADPFSVELEYTQTKYSNPGAGKQWDSASLGTYYLAPGKITKVNLAMDQHVPATNQLTFTLLKNGVACTTPLVLLPASDLNIDIVCDVDTVAGDYFTYRISQDTEYEYFNLTGTITITGNEPTVKQDLAYLNNETEMLNQKKSRIFIQAADQTVNNSTNYVTATNLQTSLKQNRLYAFKIFLHFDIKANSDVKYTIFTGSNEEDCRYKRTAEGPATAPHGTSENLTILTATPQRAIDILEGYIYTLYPVYEFWVRFAQNTAVAENTILKKGSYMIITDLGPTT